MKRIKSKVEKVVFQSKPKQFAENHGLDDSEIIYQISSHEVLKGIEDGNTDYGIIAMENAQGGGNRKC